MLPGGFAIGRRKLKGVASNGMLCSGAELGLSDDHEGILVLGSRRRPGADARDAAHRRRSGIERDVVFDITVEANRPDAWSMAGRGPRPGRPPRAALHRPARTCRRCRGPVDGRPPAAGPRSTTLAIGAGRGPRPLPPFRGPGADRASTVGDSPAWLARRLTLAGMRPINNVVDASNYVMLELGQPTHPYDLDRLAGAGLIVRRAAARRAGHHPGRRRATRRPARAGPGRRPAGLPHLRRPQPIRWASPGSWAAPSSEIAPTTTRVLLEVAYFVPMAIARTSKRLGLRTEASARFERGCDPAGHRPGGRADLSSCSP